VLQWQDIDTQGASDAEFLALSGNLNLLIITNYCNNQGQTNAMSTVYAWNTATKQFVSKQLISTIGAAAVQSFVIGSATYVAIANSFDSTLQASSIRFDGACW
jgi:EPTP domain